MVAGNRVSGDVLKSFKHDDPLITIGRWGLLVALSLNIPLLVVPIRALLLDMVGWGKPASPPLPLQTARGRGSAASKLFPAAVSTEEGGGSAAGGSATGTSAAAATPLWLHVLLTLGIVALGLYLAVVGGSVEVVWGVCGSSVGISIVFVFPAAIYLKVRTVPTCVAWYYFMVHAIPRALNANSATANWLSVSPTRNLTHFHSIIHLLRFTYTHGGTWQLRSHKPEWPRLLIARILLVGSSLAMVLCTAWSIYSITET